MATGMARHIAALKSLQGTVSVGFFDDVTYPESGRSVASVMEEQEFGNGPIPARPLMRYAAATSESVVREVVKAVSVDVIAGQMDGSILLDAVGIAVQEQIVNQIAFGDFVANAPFTIEKKGFDHPLLETGMASESVQFKVER